MSRSSGEASSVDLKEAARRWKKFAGYCRDGYPWEMEDYLVDVTLRSVINGAMRDGSAQFESLPEQVKREILETDSSLLSLFTTEAFPRAPESEWWIRNVPAYASRRFCQEFKEAYNVKIAPNSKFDADLDDMFRLVDEGTAPIEVCLKAKNCGWYVATEPALLFRACTLVLSLQRKERRAVWSWAIGDFSDSTLQMKLSES
ncbi:hypothetical protein ACWDFH_29805 [Streptomyces kronopolitis]|uniref:hypothetical protein n=1 Tax=Streptomyces kronopolitis TaxID=1612435 RepID=UPI0036B5DB2A